MNILITAGGTRESIDSVRSIANHATGRLGSVIADTFAQSGADVTYLCSETAVLPSCTNIAIVRVNNVRELEEAIKTLLQRRKFDCVIHSMAVSDYTPQAVLDIDEMVLGIMNLLQEPEILKSEMPERIRAAVLGSGKPLSDKKITSKSPELALLLRKTPKVISSIKAIQPDTLLVGFKLLSGVSENELLQAGQDLLNENACDFVLANDLVNIENDSHKAIFLDKTGILQKAATKQEIAKVIYKYVSERVGAK